MPKYMTRREERALKQCARRLLSNLVFEDIDRIASIVLTPRHGIRDLKARIELSNPEVGGSCYATLRAFAVSGSCVARWTMRIDIFEDAPNDPFVHQYSRWICCWMQVNGTKG